jgi:hypothetical protein
MFAWQNKYKVCEVQTYFILILLHLLDSRMTTTVPNQNILRNTTLVTADTLAGENDM